jgi:hypothetical protein
MNNQGVGTVIGLIVCFARLSSSKLRSVECFRRGAHGTSDSCRSAFHIDATPRIRSCFREGSPDGPQQFHVQEEPHHRDLSSQIHREQGDRKGSRSESC